MVDKFYAWQVYHPNNWKPNLISPKNYTEPPIEEEHLYLISEENEEGEYDGFLIGLPNDRPPTLTDYWKTKGWKIKSKGVWEEVVFRSRDETTIALEGPSETNTDELKIIEVHNAWTVYGLNEDGTEAENPVAQFSRPQDWGEPRWYYERFRFDRIVGGKHYINHAHCWTDLNLESHEYPQLFASLIVRILIPGHKEELCGRDYLKPEDFWFSEWGPMPPVYEYREWEED